MLKFTKHTIRSILEVHIKVNQKSSYIKQSHDFENQTTNTHITSQTLNTHWRKKKTFGVISFFLKITIW